MPLCDNLEYSEPRSEISVRVDNVLHLGKDKIEKPISSILRDSDYEEDAKIIQECFRRYSREHKVLGGGYENKFELKKNEK